MDSNKYAGILIIILGLIFMCFPLFSSVLVSVIVGVGLILLGLATIAFGLGIRHDSGLVSALTIILGIIGIIIGILFVFYLDAVAILVSVEFYILGIIMLVIGICGLITGEESKGKLMGLLIIFVGIISFLIAIFALAQPLYIAVLVGIVLILEGLMMLMK